MSRYAIAILLMTFLAQVRSREIPSHLHVLLVSRYAIAILLMTFLMQATATGNCREDSVCTRSPGGTSDTCRCWSTCNTDDGARKCDNANSQWTNYYRDNQGQNDVGCTYIPFMSNSRDMCVWYFSGNTVADAAVTTL
jgi:hypothetical protein